MRKENRLYPTALVIVAATIHTSALLMCLVVLGILIADIIKYRINGFTIILFLIATVVIINNLGLIFQKIVTDVVVFSDYEKYDISGNTGSGIFNYVLYAYILIVMILPILKSDMEPIVKNAAVVFFVFSLISSIMGYYIGSSRLNQYAFTLYGISIPWFLCQIRLGLTKNKTFVSFDIQMVTWILYLIFVTYSSLKARTDSQGTSDMAKYILFNPFTS